MSKAKQPATRSPFPKQIHLSFRRLFPFTQHGYHTGLNPIITMSSFFFRRFLLMAGFVPRLVHRHPIHSNAEQRAGTSNTNLVCQVEQVYPELVSTDANGYKAVACDALVPVLLEERKKLVDENSDLRQMLMAQQEKAQLAMENFERHLRRQSPSSTPFA